LPLLCLAQARFWTEIYDGAKLFYLSGIQHGKYLKREVFNLARFISVMKLRPLTWRLAHPYALIDRFEVSVWAACAGKQCEKEKGALSGSQEVEVLIISLATPRRTSLPVRLYACHPSVTER